jgi:hypothetical protein
MFLQAQNSPCPPHPRLRPLRQPPPKQPCRPRRHSGKDSEPRRDHNTPISRSASFRARRTSSQIDSSVVSAPCPTPSRLSPPRVSIAHYTKVRVLSLLDAAHCPLSGPLSPRATTIRPSPGRCPSGQEERHHRLTHRRSQRRALRRADFPLQGSP